MRGVSETAYSFLAIMQSKCLHFDFLKVKGFLAGFCFVLQSLRVYQELGYTQMQAVCLPYDLKECSARIMPGDVAIFASAGNKALNPKPSWQMI